MIKTAIIKKIGLSVAIFFTIAYAPGLAWAEENKVSMSVSPMNQSIVLTPGDTYHGSFKIINPNSSTTDLEYEIEQKSFYVDDNYDTTFVEVGSPIVDWTTIDGDKTGSLEPNTNVDIEFTIDVPEDVAGGGQYEAFLVKTKHSQGGVRRGVRASGSYTLSFVKLFQSFREKRAIDLINR